MAQKVFIIPHTHWDREWYQPFQEFRLRLVQLVDLLLDIMVNDPAYRFFMLDGQTVVLEDYLAVRPEREPVLRALVQEGRLLVGPWFVLPDEFLVSPEALVRNLLLGERVARRFGKAMQVGYVPDQFGHVSQLPQILRGFGMEDAVLWRGLDDEPFELRWQGPDGSEVLLIYLRGGYGNAAHLAADDPEAFAAEVEGLAADFSPHSHSGCLPLMLGTDHMEPWPGLPAAIRHARERTHALEVEHSTLPRYIQEVRASLGEKGMSALPVVRGELRACKRQHLLPGVLSMRIGLKQRNAQIQGLLERWAEPWAAFAEWQSGRLGRPLVAISPTREILWQAWRYLLENQPHDSICGCSVDQVHREMQTRFDWAEQVGEDVTRRSLEGIAAEIDTSDSDEGALAVVVFNPLGARQTDVVEATLVLPQSLEDFWLADEEGQAIPFQILERVERELLNMTLDPQSLQAMLGLVQDGKVQGRVILDVQVRSSGEKARIDIALADSGSLGGQALERQMAQVQALLQDDRVREIEIRAREAPQVSVAFVASEVPSLGYRTYWVKPGSRPQRPSPVVASPLRIENEFLVVQADPQDGTLTVLHKESGMLLPGLNRFVDGGDRGDEYNYCPPEDDNVVDALCAAPVVRLAESGPARATLEVRMLYRVPEGLTAGRMARSRHWVVLSIQTRVSLAAGVPRCDIETEVINTARDHRLRAHFPTPIATEHSWAEGHYDVVERGLTLPTDTADWVEHPQPTFPQRAFCGVSDGERGLTIGVRGLPEAEVLQAEDGVAVAVTLLRSVGWLSRDDLSTREGHAGPGLPTPDAQCLGHHTFHYSVIPHVGGWERAFRQAHAFETPMRGVPTSLHRGTMPSTDSLLRVQPESLVATAVKGAEDGEGVIVRVCNYADRAVDAEVEVPWPIRGAERVTLAERPVEVLPVAGGRRIAFGCGPWEVVTLRLRI